MAGTWRPRHRTVTAVLSAHRSVLAVDRRRTPDGSEVRACGPLRTPAGLRARA